MNTKIKSNLKSLFAPLIVGTIFLSSGCKIDAGDNSEYQSEQTSTPPALEKIDQQTALAILEKNAAGMKILSASIEIGRNIKFKKSDER